MIAETDMDTRLDCRCCGRTTLIPNVDSRSEWGYVSRDGIDSGGGHHFTHSATCPECIASAADDAVRMARETGLVTCLHPDHNSHVPGSDPFATCRQKGYLPLTDAEVERIMEAYHDARERCCPECGAGGSLSETSVEHHGFTLDGRACECGWTGRQKDLSYRKPTDKKTENGEYDE